MAGIVRCLRPSIFWPPPIYNFGFFLVLFYIYKLIRRQNYFQFEYFIPFDPINLVYLKHCVDILGVWASKPILGTGGNTYLDRVRHFRAFTCKVALQWLQWPCQTYRRHTKRHAIVVQVLSGRLLDSPWRVLSIGHKTQTSTLGVDTRSKVVGSGHTHIIIMRTRDNTVWDS